EAEAFAASTLRQDERIDAKHISLDIHEWPPAVARVDGRIGLQIDHPLLRIRLARDRTDHPHSDRVAQAFGTAHSEYEFALDHATTRSERKGRQVFGIHLEKRKIGFLMNTDQLGIKHTQLALGLDDGALSRRVGNGDNNADPLRAFDYVRVRHDVAF